jgi:hypothetical protein
MVAEELTAAQTRLRRALLLLAVLLAEYAGPGIE